MKKYGNILVILGIAFALVLMTWVGTNLLFSQADEKPAGWKHGEKEGWKSETPPGWENWDEAKRQSWKHGLARAKEAIKKHEQKRLEAALRALEKSARKGLPLDKAEKMVKTGLDHGLGAGDFEPLGKFVKAKHQQGLKGEELAEAIHQEVKHRQAERAKARQEMKEKKGVGNPEKGKGKVKEKSEEEEKDEKEGKGKGKGKGKSKGSKDDE